MSSTPPSIPPGRDLERARRHAQLGQLSEAEQAFRELLRTQPEHAEALRFLGNAAYVRKDLGDAVALLSRASRGDPNNIGLLVELGIAYRDGERLDAARYVLERAVELGCGREPVARLVLASTLEIDARPELALLHYFRAFVDAQQTRLSADNIGDSALQELIGHARRYVQDGRRAWFDRALLALRQSNPASRWDRVDAALAIYLRERDAAPEDPRQRPGFMYMPDLDTACLLDDSRFDWRVAGAADLLAPLGDDVDTCIAVAQQAGGKRDAAYRFPVLARGVEQYEARGAKSLKAALAQLPLARIPHHGPDCEIVVLGGGKQIAQHFGRANSRCWVIVNLHASAAFDVRVGGGEPRILHPAQAIAFDPSFGVEYASGGTDAARAIVVDVWHPDLSELERSAMSALFVAAVDFDTRLQDLP